MKVNAVQSLGFGFPGFYSQARGSGVVTGTPFANFAPLTNRAEENLPPKVKARLRGLRGRGRLGQWESYDFTVPAADSYFPYAQEFTDSTYTPSVTTPMPSAQQWQTSLGYEGSQGESLGTSNGIDWDAAVANITKLVQAGLTWDAQRKILDLNLARAQAGLPAIDASRLAPGMNFGITPDTQKMLMIGGVALAAVLLLKKSK